MSEVGATDMDSAMQNLTVTRTDVKAIPLQPCGNCGKECSQSCGNCRKQSYCSVICQKARRKEHKLICFPATEEIGDGFRARGYGPRSFWVATRDIEEGERIFIDYPLVVAPGQGASFKEHICTGCHEILKDFVVETDRRKCSRCGWPLCGLTCSGIRRHLKDCEALSWMRENRNYDADLFEMKALLAGVICVYDPILQIRLFALIKDDPMKWERYLNLYVPESRLKKVTESLSADIKKLDLCVSYMKNGCQLEELTNEMYFRFIALLNFHRSPSYNWRADKSKAEVLIYDKETRMDMSCMENCYVFEIPISENKKKDPHGIVIVAAKGIQNGQRLTMAFPGLPKWDGTKRRRQIRMKNPENGEIGFICKCPRCVDPTELGTNVSAVKCTQCNKGHLLPVNPLDDNSEWKCDIPECPGLFTASYVDNIVDKIQKEADVVAVPAKFVESNKLGFYSHWDRMERVKKFVDKYEQILNPHHYILLNITEEITLTHTLSLLKLLTFHPIKEDTSSLWILDNTERHRITAGNFLDLARKIFTPLSLPQLYGHFLVGMDYFILAQQAVQMDEELNVVLCCLEEGLTHRRLIAAFNREKSLPVGCGGELPEKLELWMRDAYNDTMKLCRSDYGPIPEMFELESSCVGVSSASPVVENL